MVLYVATGNFILGIKGMFFTHWFMLFSTSCFANILGLNISASFNSAKVIYILIPILIIPQLLFSGVIVKFDKLHPWFASQAGVPWIGNVMASRWAYEAMAVAQYKENEHEKHFYQLKKNKSFSKWKKDYWIVELETKISEARRAKSDTAVAKKLKDNLEVLQNEIRGEMNFIEGFPMKSVDKLTPEAYNDAALDDAQNYLKVLKQHYKQVFNDNEKAMDSLIQVMMRDSLDKNGKLALDANGKPIHDGSESYNKLLDDYTNESLENFVLNKMELEATVEENGHLVQKKELIYRDPYDKGFFGAHFYAPRKRLFGQWIDTYWGNTIVIWGMTLTLCLTLYFDALKRLLDSFGKIRLFPKKKR
jgi:hypothetical protein